GRSDGCLLVLEDLHNVDAETLAIVEYLVDNLNDLPVLLLATMRNEACAAMDLARSAAQRHSASVILLNRLMPADVGRLVASCLEAEVDELPTDVVAQVVEDSAGIPFIVEELLHQLIGDGVLAKDMSGWHVAGHLRGA